jgi:hypothetical protein
MLAFALAGTLLPFVAPPASAQIAPPPTRIKLPASAFAEAPPRRPAATSSSPIAQAPLGVANQILLMRTMAGVQAMRPQVVKCDASEIDLGRPGEAFVAGDIRIINTGAGKCPPVGRNVRDPRNLLDRSR